MMSYMYNCGDIFMPYSLIVAQTTGMTQRAYMVANALNTEGE